MTLKRKNLEISCNLLGPYSRIDLQSAVREVNIRTGEDPDANPADETRDLLFGSSICLLNELQKPGINEGAKLLHARVILAAMTAPVLLLLCTKLKRPEVLNVILNEESLIGLVEILGSDMDVSKHLSNLTPLTLRVIPRGEEYLGGIQIEKL